MDGGRSDGAAVAALPEQRPSEQAPTSAEVLRSFGLDALVELVEGSPHPLGTLDEDGRWAYLNAAGCRQLGLTSAQVVGTLAPPGTVQAGPATAVAGRRLTPAVPPDAGSLDDELRRQAARTAAAQERHRLGRDLHDSVSSALFALHTRTQVVDRALAAGDLGLLAAAAADMQALSGQAIAELRAMVSTMRDDAPEAASAQDGGPDRDLAAALERLAATSRSRDGLEVHLCVARPLPAVPSETAEHLLRIAAEAVHNCSKHAGTEAVDVELAVRGSELVLTVADDGRGFDPATVPADRHGQRTMRERAVLCGGWLHVDTAPGRGARVVARLPLPG